MMLPKRFNKQLHGKDQPNRGNSGNNGFSVIFHCHARKGNGNTVFILLGQNAIPFSFQIFFCLQSWSCSHIQSCAFPSLVQTTRPKSTKSKHGPFNCNSSSTVIESFHPISWSHVQLQGCNYLYKVLLPMEMSHISLTLGGAHESCRLFELCPM